MNKKAIIGIILCTLIIFSSISTYAFSVSNMTGTNLNETSQAAVDKVGQGVIKVITTIGSILSVIVLIILGLKYMMGSVEEKAEYKKTMMPYVIGATILFGASTFASVIYNVVIKL